MTEAMQAHRACTSRTRVWENCLYGVGADVKGVNNYFGPEVGRGSPGARFGFWYCLCLVNTIYVFPHIGPTIECALVPYFVGNWTFLPFLIFVLRV